MATTKGHLNQKWQGSRTTMMDDNSVKEHDNAKSHQAFIATSDMAEKSYWALPH